ncbi:SAM-dependent methyltransferase [Amycolatopsis rubida]|uniref:S-adenosyl methyltransferase n=1 Tax=Amycolatopsis rubida TaxID=112413 RepID=A0A1I5XFL3_9PSEU|nr:SAM-dependent methyltransferase [Amycolatopsis rubida]SFQ30749.1 S-adenosyl methyltransferase [Amycolatopsis rubida]
MADAKYAPPGVDPNQASIARVYDYFLGGNCWYEKGLEAVNKILRELPDAKELAWVNRNLLTRVCRFLSQTGVRQFLDIGSGLPTAENVHQIVQRADPTARVLYVDYDPVVAAHGRAILAENDNTEFVLADAFDPPSILQNPVVRDHLNWDEPIALLYMAVLHHRYCDTPADRAVAAAATLPLIDALPPGSYVAISHLIDPHDGSDDDTTVKNVLGAVDSSSMKNVTALTLPEIEALFHDTELIPPGPHQPAGIVRAALWWPDGPLGELSPAQRILAAGVAKKL